MKTPTFEQVKEILKGIDKTEYDQDQGWWETFTGAEFGKAKLQEIEALFNQED